MSVTKQELEQGLEAGLLEPVSDGHAVAELSATGERIVPNADGSLTLVQPWE